MTVLTPRLAAKMLDVWIWRVSQRDERPCEDLLGTALRLLDAAPPVPIPVRRYPGSYLLATRRARRSRRL